MTRATGSARLRRRAGVALVLSVAVVVGFVVYAVHLASEQPTAAGSFPTATVAPGLGRGTTAPAFRLRRLGGGSEVSLSALGARPVVLNFFASWCTDCRAELGAFAAVARRAGDRVAFVGIDTDDSAPGTALSLLRRAGASYPVGRDPDGAVAGEFRLPNALPVTYFLDAEHRVVAEALGQQDERGLEGWIVKLEAAAPRSSSSGRPAG